MCNEKSFESHLEWASKTVRRWPKWKQDILGGFSVSNDHNNMTLSECQDWLAVDDGWEFKYNSWWHPDTDAFDHPYMDTRNVRMALPNDWVFGGMVEYRGMENPWRVTAYHELRPTIGPANTEFGVVSAHGNTEDEARARLAVAARQENRRRRKETRTGQA